MQRLTKLLNDVKRLLGGMTTSQRMLLVSLAVVLLMALFVVQQYTGSPTMVPLLDASYPADDQQAAAKFLDTKGVEYETSTTGVVMVSPGTRPRLLAQMSQTPGALPSDTTILFSNLIDKQSWVRNNEQNRQLETIALQNELAFMLSQWEGIKSANVIIDVPSTRSIGQPSLRPTAAVNIMSDNGLSQSTVDAIAAFVAGSRQRAWRSIGCASSMEPPAGRCGARSDDQLNAATTQELVAQIEQRKQQQLADMLVYIQGVIVTVQAQVDSTHRTTTTDATLPEGQGSTSLLESETTMTRRDNEPARFAEPGVRANTGADITNAAIPPVATSEENHGETTFENRFGSKVERVIDPRGFATKINAVVNIPRGYFVTIWQDQQKRQNPSDAGAGAKDPTDADLQAIIEAEVMRIRDDVRQLVDTSGGDGALPGEVKVSMIPTMAAIGVTPSTAGMGGLLGFGGGAGGASMPDLVKTVALGGLAMLALGLVVVTAVKSSRRQALPSAGELLGVPPTLGQDSGLVGEAVDAESALTGIELTDDVMQNKKIMEQVSAMIKDKPDIAATLVGRWIGENR